MPRVMSWTIKELGLIWVLDMQFDQSLQTLINVYIVPISQVHGFIFPFFIVNSRKFDLEKTNQEKLEAFFQWKNCKNLFLILFLIIFPFKRGF